MSSKYFIGLLISQSISGNFPGIFGIFRIFSMTLLIYLDISGFIFFRKIFRKKTFLFYLGRARRLDPVHFGPAAGPRSPSGPGSQGWPGQAAAVPRRACRTRQAHRHRAYLRQSPSPSCHAPYLPPTAFICAAQPEPRTAADSPPHPVVVPSPESRRLASAPAKSHVATGHRRFRRTGALLDGADTFQSYATLSRVPSSARRCRTSTGPPPEAPRPPVNQPPPSRLSLHMLICENFCFILLRFYFSLHNSKIQSRNLFHQLQVLLLDLHSVIYIISTYFFSYSIFFSTIYL
jgi:hypothetical protein